MRGFVYGLSFAFISAMLLAGGLGHALRFARFRGILRDHGIVPSAGAGLIAVFVTGAELLLGAVFALVLLLPAAALPRVALTVASAVLGLAFLLYLRASTAAAASCAVLRLFVPVGAADTRCPSFPPPACCWYPSSGSRRRCSEGRLRSSGRPMPRQPCCPTAGARRLRSSCSCCRRPWRRAWNRTERHDVARFCLRQQGEPRAGGVLRLVGRRGAARRYRGASSSAVGQAGTGQRGLGPRRAVCALDRPARRVR